jgi:hypothetical protein
MSRLDRFNEDFRRLQDLERMINENLKERELNLKKGMSTGKVSSAISSLYTG